MCEILVRVKDKIGDNVYHDSKCTKRGDVIVVEPDGWGWGNDEKKVDFYRILSFPGQSVEEFEVFLGTEKDNDPTQPSLTLQKRAFALDLDKLGQDSEVSKYLSDDTRVKPMQKIVGYEAHAFKITKPRIEDPAILGVSGNIF